MAGITDNPSKALLKKLISDRNISQSSRDYFYTILLNAILVPTTIRESNKAKKNTAWKPTVADGRRALAIFVQNIKDVPRKIRNRKIKYS